MGMNCAALPRPSAGTRSTAWRQISRTQVEGDSAGCGAAPRWAGLVSSVEAVVPSAEDGTGVRLPRPPEPASMPGWLGRKGEDGAPSLPLPRRIPVARTTTSDAKLHLADLRVSAGGERAEPGDGICARTRFVSATR